MASVAGGRITAGVGANLIGQHAQDRNQEATVYVGNLDVQLSEETVWELFIQAGPLVNVYLPKDRVTSQHQGYGFVEFKSEEDADYAIKVLNMIKVYGKPIRVNKASQDKKTADVGANLFIGNIDPDVDEKLLYDTFSAFGMIIQTPKIMRDPETGASRGFGFVSYEGFEASDAAIEAMNGQFLCNRPISVTYAFKKDSSNVRHGTPAERLLAEQQRTRMAAANRPHTLFAAGPKQRPDSGLPAAMEEAAPAPPAPPPPPPQMNGFGAPPPAPAGMPPPPAHMPPPPPAFFQQQQQQAQQQQPRPPAPGPPQQGTPPSSGPPSGSAPQPLQGSAHLPPWAQQSGQMAMQRPPPQFAGGPAPWQQQRPSWAQPGMPPGMPRPMGFPPGMPPPPGYGPPRPGFPPGMPPPPGWRPGMPPQRPPGMPPPPRPQQ